MEPIVQWITTGEALEDTLRGTGAGPVAVDTEADSMHHYPEKVCLIQLSFRGRDYLIDPLAGIDVSAFAALMADGERRKILHGADYDLRVLHRDFAVRVRGLFDTMVAARLTGERRFGLAALLESRLSIKLDKKYQRADWSRRPLPEPMVRYAVLDTRHLEALAGLLIADLERLGRVSWAEEEFRRLETVRWTDSPEGEAFRKIRGATKLSRRELAVLRELVAVRETEARKRDRPPFRILSNDTLLDLARAMPARREDLRETRALPDRWRGGEAARRLVEAVDRARALGDSELPRITNHRRPPRDPRFDSEVKRLGRERDRIAKSSASNRRSWHRERSWKKP